MPIFRESKKENYRFEFLYYNIGVTDDGGHGSVSYLLFSRNPPQNSITINNAASSGEITKILLIIALIGSPLVGIYTTFVFRTFKGKVKPDEMSYLCIGKCVLTLSLSAIRQNLSCMDLLIADG